MSSMQDFFAEFANLNHVQQEIVLNKLKEIAEASFSNLVVEGKEGYAFKIGRKGGTPFVEPNGCQRWLFEDQVAIKDPKDKIIVITLSQFECWLKGEAYEKVSQN